MIVRTSYIGRGRYCRVIGKLYCALSIKTRHRGTIHISVIQRNLWFGHLTHVNVVKMMLIEPSSFPSYHHHLRDTAWITLQPLQLLVIGICMGGPGVFLGHPYPYPGKPIPGCSGAGNYGHGHGDQLGSRVPEGISGYRFLSHVFGL